VVKSQTGGSLTTRSSAGAEQGPAQMAFLEGQLAEIQRRWLDMGGFGLIPAPRIGFLKGEGECFCRAQVQEPRRSSVGLCHRKYELR
jgi:hypothetical protein